MGRVQINRGGQATPRAILVCRVALVCFFTAQAVMLSGCAVLRSHLSVDQLLPQAGARGFETVQSNYPGLILLKKPSTTAAPLWIFIEGDGAPFGKNGEESLSNPTPHHSIALALALSLGEVGGAYLSRPCQYVALTTTGPCRDTSLWQARRFGNQALDLTSSGMEALMRDTAGEIHLVGHSGGGVLARGLAAKYPARVRCIITLASPPDVADWAKHHAIQGLEVAQETSPNKLPAETTHYSFFGDQDKVIGPELVVAWHRQFLEMNNPNFYTGIVEATHSRGWLRFWKKQKDRLCSAQL